MSDVSDRLPELYRHSDGVQLHQAAGVQVCVRLAVALNASLEPQPVVGSAPIRLQ